LGVGFAQGSFFTRKGHRRSQLAFPISFCIVFMM
jgi:hypothetical protein